MHIRLFTARTKSQHSKQSTGLFYRIHGNKKKNPPSQHCVMTDSYLLEDLGNAKKDIDTILLHLNYQTEPDLIDSYTYQLKGAYLRYKFLLQEIQKTASI